MTADATQGPNRRRPAAERTTPRNGVLGAVTITAREIYDAVMRLTSRVDAALDHAEHQAEKIDDHEGRIRSLEQSRWPLPSLAAVIALVGLAVAIFTR